MIEEKNGNADMKVSKKEAKHVTNSHHACSNCNKLFPSLGKLQQHVFVHTGEKPFKCTNCEKSFSSKFKLMRHMLIHSSDRKYSCSMCDRCFHRKDHLKNHLQVHNPNKKLHRCEQCSKEYNSRLSYRKHVAIHAAEAGDLNCKVCNKNFKTSDEILYHLKVHAGSRTIKNPNEKKFKCDFCDRRFFTRKDVKRHLVVHTGRRDFLCQFCPQRFGRKDHLVRHIKKGHALPQEETKQILDAQNTKNVMQFSSSSVSLVSYPTTQPVVYNEMVQLMPKVESRLPDYSDAGPSGLYPIYKNYDGVEIKTERLEELQPVSGYTMKVSESSYETDRFYSYIPVASVPLLPVEEDGVPPLPRFSQAFQ